MRIAGVDWRLDVRYREKAFTGTVAIEVHDAPDPLIVDSERLEILSAALDGRPATYRVDPAKGRLEFPDLAVGAHRLEISYRGMADANSLVGMYVSPSGKGYALTTMLFPSGSRRLLPSFEDPSVKTVYRLTLTTDPDVKAIFNTSVASDRLTGGRREWIFAATPPMSAYLLYLGVGPFDTITVPGHPWSVTVAAPPGRAEAGRFCAERASDFLSAYEEYFGISYPLSKLDLVALENFWAGAMENWGAIAFRESVVLVDPSTTVRERRLNLLVLAHEIAHQWFGNLVTPVSWDDFWLNESFATYVGHHIVGQRFPGEFPWTYFMTRYGAGALFEDAFAETHPVRVPITSVEQLGEIADDVTYGKGAYVLRMIASYLGESAFRKGVARYLSEHRYQNARAEDLWRSLAEVSDLPVERVMTEWITRPGYPIIHATWTGSTLSLRQERFRADGAPSPATWPIPLRVTTAGSEREKLFDSTSWDLPLPSAQGLRINPERTAFARVHYDERLFDRVLGDLGSWSPIDQWGVAIDTHAFVYAGVTTVSRFLDLIRAAETAVTDELPLAGFLFALGDLGVPLHDHPEFRATARSFLKAQRARIGADREPSEPDSFRLARESITNLLVQMDPEVARDLARRFAEIDRVSPELRPAVALAYAVAEGESAFTPLLERLRSTPSDGERSQLMRALGGFRDPALLRRTLDVVPGPGITPSGSLHVFEGLFRNPAAGAPLFEWYKERERSLSEMWSGTPSLSLFLTLCIPVMALTRENEVDRYFRDHTPSEARMAVGQALETSRLWSRLRREVTRRDPEK